MNDMNKQNKPEDSPREEVECKSMLGREVICDGKACIIENIIPRRKKLPTFYQICTVEGGEQATVHRSQFTLA
jgi:hypothetical protein